MNDMLICDVEMMMIFVIDRWLFVIDRFEMMMTFVIDRWLFVMDR
jgi:hypothetical protein